MSARRSSNSRRWLKLGVSVGLLALLFIVLPWSQVSAAWRQVSASIWISILGAFIAVHFLGVMKWRTMVNANAGVAALKLFDATRYYAAGLFANLCLPSIVGGDVIRAALAGRRVGRPEAVLMGSVADRILDVVVLAILIGIGGILAGATLVGWSTQLALLLAVVGSVIIVLFVPFLLRRPLRRWPPPFRRRIARALVSIRRMARRPTAALTAFVLALVIQSIFVMLNAALGYSLGIDLPLSVWFLAWPLAKAAGLLPISLGGLGIRDATLAALLVPFGVPMAQGFVASLAWQTILIGGGLLGGGMWWLTSSFRPSDRPIPLLSSEGLHG